MKKSRNLSEKGGILIFRIFMGAARQYIYVCATAHIPVLYSEQYRKLVHFGRALILYLWNLHTSIRQLRLQTKYPRQSTPTINNRPPPMTTTTDNERLSKPTINNRCRQPTYDQEPSIPNDRQSTYICTYKHTYLKLMCRWVFVCLYVCLVFTSHFSAI